jgi:hypothetical protein
MVPNITLMEVKKFVESVPKVLKEDEMRREADRLHFSSKRRAHWLAFYLSVISSFPGHPPSSSFSPLAVLVPFHSIPSPIPFLHCPHLSALLSAHHLPLHREKPTLII